MALHSGLMVMAIISTITRHVKSSKMGLEPMGSVIVHNS